jgi:hypothetical protein
VENLTKKQMIESLVSFREASDQLNDDLSNLSEKILSILAEVNGFADMSEREQKIQQKLAQLVEPILYGLKHSHHYNESMWKDYTQVVKALGASKDVKNNDN